MTLKGHLHKRGIGGRKREAVLGKGKETGKTKVDQRCAGDKSSPAIRIRTLRTPLSKQNRGFYIPQRYGKSGKRSRGEAIKKPVRQRCTLVEKAYTLHKNRTSQGKR